MIASLAAEQLQTESNSGTKLSDKELQQLAEKIVALLRDEIRLEVERTGTSIV